MMGLNVWELDNLEHMSPERQQLTSRIKFYDSRYSTRSGVDDVIDSQHSIV